MILEMEDAVYFPPPARRAWNTRIGISPFHLSIPARSTICRRFG